MAINFGLLNTQAPAEIGNTIGNALLMRRKLDQQDQDRAAQQEQQSMQNALLRMNMQKQQADMNEETAYKNALGGVQNGDYTGSMPQLMQASPSRALSLQKQLTEQQKALMESRAKLTDLQSKKLEMYRSQLTDVQTPEQMAQWYVAQRNDPDMKGFAWPTTIEDTLSQLQQASANPRDFEQWKLKTALGMKAFMESQPKPTTFMQELQARGIQPGSPQWNAALEAKANKETTHAPAASITNYGQPVSAVDPQTGQPVLVQFDKSGQAKVAPFAPYNAGAAEKKASKEAGSKSAIQLIDEALPWIDKATGSNVGAARDAAGRLVGMSSQASQAAARLEALQGALMMAQPRMEGPQSNLDVALYERMAGRIGDRTVPAAEKRAAMDTIRALHQKYTGGAQPSPSRPAQGGVKFLGFE